MPCVLDAVLQKDASRARYAALPRVLAAPTNVTPAILRLLGESDLRRTLRCLYRKGSLAKQVPSGISSGCPSDLLLRLAGAGGPAVRFISTASARIIPTAGCPDSEERLLVSMTNENCALPGIENGTLPGGFEIGAWHHKHSDVAGQLESGFGSCSMPGAMPH